MTTLTSGAGDDEITREIREVGGSTLGLFSKLNAMVSKLDDGHHSYKPSLSKFQDIDVQKLTRDLDVERRGTERGNENEPPLEGTQFDTVENEIVNKIRSLKSEAQSVYSGEMEVLTERISGLDFEGNLGKVTLELNSGIQEFKRIIHNGLGRHHSLRRELIRKENELKDFRKEHARKLSAHYHPPHIKAVLIAIVMILFLGESFGNSYFLSKGNEYGIVGAYTEAFAISLVNLGGAWLLARFAIYILHVRVAMKIIGLFAIMLFLGGGFFLNLFVAHYRDATGILMESGGSQAVTSFKESMFGLDEFSSWMLFAMGSLFSCISFLEGLNWDEKYPGYGRVSRSADTARDAYINESEYQVSQLEAAQEEAVEELKDTRENLSRWRREHGALLDHRRSWIEALSEHLDQLEEVGGTLLNIYREANRKARGGKAPKRFKDKWSLSRQKADPLLPPEALSKEELNLLLDNANSEIESGIAELNRLHDLGLEKYRKLDDLVSDEDDLELGDVGVVTDGTATTK